MTIAPAPETALEAGYFHLTPTAATLRPETPFDECEEGLHSIALRRDATAWWIGDLLNQARDLYGERWSQLVDEDKVNTYRAYMWLAKEIPEDLRHPAIPYSWYRDAAKLPMEKLSQVVTAATEGDTRQFDYRQWLEAIAEQCSETPKTPRRTAKDKAADVVSYVRNMEGKHWDHDCTVVVVDLLK